MTFLQSKGLEFPVVIVGSLGQTPYPDTDTIGETLRGLYNRTPLEPVNRIRKRLYPYAMDPNGSLAVTYTVEDIQKGRAREDALADQIGEYDDGCGQE